MGCFVPYAPLVFCCCCLVYCTICLGAKPQTPACVAGLVPHAHEANIEAVP